jgi:hypothetical protein
VAAFAVDFSETNCFRPIVVTIAKALRKRDAQCQSAAETVSKTELVKFVRI